MAFKKNQWIRIYPVPLSFLLGQRQSGKMQSFKYTWMELDLIRRTDDFRPGSFSPKNHDFRDLKLFEKIDARDNWVFRKDLCLQNVFANLDELIEQSKAPINKWLATFKPTTIERLEKVGYDPEWKNEWKNRTDEQEAGFPNMRLAS